LADQIARTTGADRSQEISLQELDEAIDIKTDEEASPEEKSIMKGVVKFGNIAVKQIMRSRLDVSGVEWNTSFPQLVERVKELHYSRLPVYKGSLDEVVGILYTKDLIPHLNAPENFDWHTLLRSPYFVPEPKLIEDLLKVFQQRRIHFAIVVDEFGGTSGIVTMEDILEEVIGDIRDEFDEEEVEGQQLDASTYIFEGKIMLTDLCRAMRLPLDTFDQVKGESDSLAGLLLEQVGALPVKDQVVICGDFEFKVLEIQQNRIQRVQVSIKFQP
jgi:gliding motility-associated protein GldE